MYKNFMLLDSLAYEKREELLLLFLQRLWMLQGVVVVAKGSGCCFMIMIPSYILFYTKISSCSWFNFNVCLCYLQSIFCFLVYYFACMSFSVFLRCRFSLNFFSSSIGNCNIEGIITPEEKKNKPFWEQINRRKNSPRPEIEPAN